jgi:sugar/nucleoside kinase (ribokinase family)
VPDVVCLGILVADVVARPVEEIPRGRLVLLDDISLHGGGCALNTATALARFDLKVAVAGQVGSDAFGDFLLRLLGERGIEHSAVLRGTGRTAATVVLVDGRGEQAFLHLPGGNAVLEADELDRKTLFAGRALHVAGALVMPALDGEPTASLLTQARACGVLTSLDPAHDATGRWERLRPCLPHLDLFTPSLTEARAISGRTEPADATAWAREQGVREVAITLGADGCYVAGPDFEGHVPACRVPSVDGTGAGDAFAAGLLYGRLAGWPLEQSARLANAVGALATTAAGATDGVRGLKEALSLAGLEDAAWLRPRGRISAGRAGDS